MSKKHFVRHRSPLRSAFIEPLESRTLLSASPATVGFIDLTDSVAYTSTKPILPGSGKEKVAVTVTNEGDIKAAGPLEIELDTTTHSDGSHSTLLIDEQVVLRGLAASKSKTFDFSVPITVGTAPANYYTVAIVDGGNTFSESNPNNNTAVTPSALTVLDLYPNIEGVFDGTFAVTSGPGKGDSGTNELDVETESNTTGEITGILTSSAGFDANLEGGILPNGQFSANTADTGDSGTGVITGRLHDGKLTGKLSQSDGTVSKFTIIV
jgi:hypothetical protein